MPAQAVSDLDLSPTRTHTNLAPAELVERAIRAGEGRLAADGSLVCRTGDRTGRSPNDKHLEDTPEIREQYRDLVLDDIAEHTGVDLRDRIVFEESFCVDDFSDRYNSQQGTALGLAHTLTQTSFLRPPHASEAMDGLYFTGSYTTPGIGVPMCLISGRLTAETVAKTTETAAK